MTDALTREHGRALLACALFGRRHTARTHWDLPPGTSTRKFNKLASLQPPIPIPP